MRLACWCNLLWEGTTEHWFGSPNFRTTLVGCLAPRTSFDVEPQKRHATPFLTRPPLPRNFFLTFISSVVPSHPTAFVTEPHRKTATNLSPNAYQLRFFRVFRVFRGTPPTHSLRRRASPQNGHTPLPKRRPTAVPPWHPCHPWCKKRPRTPSPAPSLAPFFPWPPRGRLTIARTNSPTSNLTLSHHES
ncbi:MAG: hypothetical protein RIT02_4151 [Planctomycetota bacterium]